MNEGILLRRSEAALIVVDVQDFFARSCWQGERVVKNVSALVAAGRELCVPALATEQRPDVFGKTPAKITETLALPVQNKTCFSVCGVPKINDFLKENGKTKLVVCGYESHICVQQTCLDALEKGFDVYLVQDACSAYSQQLHEIGMKRCEAAGAIPYSTESIIFELIGDAGSPEFRKLLPLIKSLRS